MLGSTDCVITCYIFGRNSNNKYSWLNFHGIQPWISNINPQQMMKLNLLIIFHKNLFNHKISCLQISKKNKPCNLKIGHKEIQDFTVCFFFFLIHKHSPCAVIVLKHLTFSSPWRIVIVTPYSNHRGVHPVYITQKLNKKLIDLFVFDKNFLFFLSEIGFNVTIRSKVTKCLYSNIVLFLVAQCMLFRNKYKEILYLSIFSVSKQS